MRKASLCVIAATLIAAVVSAGTPSASAATARQSYLPLAATDPLCVPSIASVLPARGDVVGVGHPVVVSFSGSVADRRAAERTIDIKSVPARTGKFEWLDNKVVQWVPDRFWPARTTIALSVGSLKTEFVTGPAVIGIASISDRTFTVSIDGLPAGPPIELPAPHHRPNWGRPGVFPASMGRPEYPTPVGTYTVMARERDVVMDSSSVGIPIDSPDGYLVEVEYAIRFTSRGLFVHSAPWNINSLGYENTSHGCIGLSTEDAKWYFNTVKVGDPIIVQENSIEVPRIVSG